VSIGGLGFIPVPIGGPLEVTTETETEPVTVVTITQPAPTSEDPCSQIRRDHASWDPADLNHKGMVEFDKSNFRTAQCWFELAHKRLENTGRTEEPLTVNVLENLAKTYEALGKREEASSVSYRASTLRERLKM
jgi:hypothetical protein